MEIATEKRENEFNKEREITISLYLEISELSLVGIVGMSKLLKSK